MAGASASWRSCARKTAAAGVPLLLLLVSSAICDEILKSHGTAAQQARWLPPMASGQDKMAFAITEPDAGSNTTG